ncbi:MAG: hypothetical protein ACRYFZ_18880 [Janthinobacterium lividum]
MKLFAWLRALLPSPTPAAGPSTQQLPAPAKQVSHSGPLVPIPRLSPAQREARAKAREPHILAAVADSQAQAQARGILVNLHPAIYRLDMERKYLQADIVEAQGMGWVIDELHLHLELQLVEAETNLRMWHQSLMQRYGPELGAKLGQHEVAVGMRWEHVVVCYGPPPAGAMQQLAGHPNRWRVQYGSQAAGSYFELVDEVVTVARLGVPTLPAHMVGILDLQQ